MATPDDLNKKVDNRLPFQEIMKLAPLPDRNDSDGKIVKRYMSQRAAWLPGCDLLESREELGLKGAVAYGGHVFSQAGMAASRALRESRLASSSDPSSRRNFGVHFDCIPLTEPQTIHGYFSEAGRPDRPFIYNVTTVAANPSFHNLLVSVRQPKTRTKNPKGDHFPPEDAQIQPGPVCFTALVSFRPSSPSQADLQEPPPHVRFHDILSSRPPSQWSPTPFIDIDGIVAAAPPTEPGSFPAVDMKKVDLTAWNRGRPMHERRELILYRLLAPLPASDPDAHIMAHAFEADRNGLLMIGNHAGFGFDFGRAASLSYSFVVHVNPEDAVMRFGEDEWWVQEACFPRVEAGRGIIMSKIWSPRGAHVATEYQDGIVRRNVEAGEGKGKL